jgi:hypothetical protein
MLGTLGDGKPLGTDVGGWMATAGPLIFVVFPELKKRPGCSHLPNKG